MPDLDRPLFLCLDTATSTARVAVVDEAGTVRFATEATADRHSSHVLRLCAEAMAAVGVKAAGLAGIACGAGPGSFTGLRVGLAVAKGLALPAAVPLYVVSSLEALALDLVTALGPEITAVPCLDAGKAEVYIGAYASDRDQLVRETKATCRLPSAEIAAWVADLGRAAIAGNGAVRYPTNIGSAHPGGVIGPTAVSVGRLALGQRRRGEVADLDRAVPFYGRPPDITVRKNKG